MFVKPASHIISAPSNQTHHDLGATLGLPGGLDVLTACPKLIGCVGAKPGLDSGLAYAPGIGTDSYCCSPGAAGTCSARLSGAGSNPSWPILGVACCTLIGGACKVKGFGCENDDCRFWAYCTFSPFSAASSGSCRWGGKAGDMGDLKPGVLGADWVRNWARYRSSRALSRRSIDL